MKTLGKLKTLFIFLIAASSGIAIQAQSLFQKTWGSRKEQIKHILKVPSGGFLVVGSCREDSASLFPKQDALVIRMDDQGAEIWSKKFGRPDFSEELAQAKMGNDGSFILAGTVERRDSVFQNRRDDMLLMKMDNAGNTLWSRMIGDDDDDEKAFALEVKPNGYALFGYTMSDSAYYMAPIQLQLDENGNVLSHNLLEDDDDDDFITACTQVSGGGFMCCGYTRSYGLGNGNVYLIRYDSNGEVLWYNTHSFPGEKSQANSIVPSPDGGFFIAGYAEVVMTAAAPGIPPVVEQKMLAMKVDANGDTLWTRCYGDSGAAEALAMAATPDGGLVLAGKCKPSPIGGGDNVCLLKINANGGLIWAKSFAGSDNANDQANSVAVLSDGSIVWAGFWNQSNNASSAVFVKTDAEGNNSCLIQPALSLKILASGFIKDVHQTQILHLENPHSRPDTNVVSEAPVANTLCPAAVEVEEFSESMQLLPNPASQTFYIRGITNLGAVWLIDLLGRRQEIYPDANGAYSIEGMRTGLYVVEIGRGSARISRRLFIE